MKKIILFVLGILLLASLVNAGFTTYYYPIEEGVGDETIEYSNLTANATFASSYEWLNQSEYFNYSIDLKNSYMLIPQPLVVLLQPYFTICMWINITNSPGTSYLFRQNDGDIDLRVASNAAITTFARFDNGLKGFGSNANAFNFNESNQICINYDGLKYKIIVNNTIIKNDTQASGTTDISNDTWNIGAWGTNNAFFNGSLDDFAAYNGTEWKSFVQHHYDGNVSGFLNITPPIQNATQLPNSLACWGDSITLGQWVSTPYFYNSYSNQTNGTYNTTIYGTPGITTSGMLSHDWDTTPYDKLFNRTLILAGTNNLIETNLTELQEDYYSDMNQIIPDLLAFNQTVMMSTIPPQNFSTYGTEDNNQTKVNLINDVIRRLTFDYNLIYCDVFTDVFGQTYSDTYFDLPDKVHPNQQAHNEMNTTYIDCFNTPVSFNCDSNESACFNYTSPIPPDPSPNITSLTATSITSSAATLAWTCSENCNYSILVYNSTTKTPTNLWDTINVNTFATSRSQGLTSLVNFTDYYINLTVWDNASQTGENNTFSFKTLQITPVTPSASGGQVNNTIDAFIAGLAVFGSFAVIITLIIVSKLILLILRKEGTVEAQMHIRNVAIAAAAVIVLGIVVVIGIIILSTFKTVL